MENTTENPKYARAFAEAAQECEEWADMAIRHHGLPTEARCVAKAREAYNELLRYTPSKAPSTNRWACARISRANYLAKLLRGLGYALKGY